MGASVQLTTYIKANPGAVGKVVDFNAQTDRLYQLDLTTANKELDAATLADTEKFNRWINEKLVTNNCLYVVGGYMENRTI
jgi:hypothetical protein